MAFAQARVARGFELFAKAARLDRRLRRADLVLTGEGRIDASTLMGKGTGQVADWCEARGLGCVGLAGSLATRGRPPSGFTQVHALTDLALVHEAKANPRVYLERLAARVARGVTGGKGCSREGGT